MNQRDAMKMALEALDRMYTPKRPSAYDFQAALDAINALRTALAEPEQEPVAWRYKFARGVRWDFAESDPAEWRDLDVTAEPLYTHPVDDTALLRRCLNVLLNDCDPKADIITALRDRLGEKA